jgi:hypothetical protein
MRVSCWLAGFLVACAGTAGSARAQAAPSSVEAKDAPRQVAVRVHGGPSGQRIVAATIAEGLARIGVTMVDVSVIDDAGPMLLASVDVEIREAEARVTAMSPAGDVLLDRIVRDTNPEIRREQIAAAVLGVADAALLADADRRAAPVSAPPAAKAPIAQPSEERDAPPNEPPRSTLREDRSLGKNLALDLSTMLGVGPLASTAGLITRVGGAASLVYRSGPRPSLSLSGLYAFPFEADDQGTRAKLSSLRAIASVEPVHATWFALDVGAGGGLDVFSFQPLSTSVEGPRLLSQRSIVQPVLTGTVVAHVPIASSVVLNLAATLDVSTAVREDPAGGTDRRDATFSPWTVRPMLVAGFSFTTLGRSRFSKPAHRSASSAHGTVR